jgi:hypothetical protein
MVRFKFKERLAIKHKWGERVEQKKKAVITTGGEYVQQCSIAVQN